MHQLLNQPWRRTENCCHLLSRHRSYCWDIVKLQQQEHQTDSCRQVIYFFIIILRRMMFKLCRCRNSKKLQRIPDEYGGRKQRELQIFIRGDKPFSFSFSTNELYTIFQRFHKTQRGELVKVSSVSRTWIPTALGHRHLQWLEESISQKTWETNLNSENCIQNLLNLFNFINYLQRSVMFSAMAVRTTNLLLLLVK